MTLLELFIMAVGLAMDAFAVSICKGLATQKVTLKHSFITGAWFGGFQALMPLIGFGLGSANIATDFGSLVHETEENIAKAIQAGQPVDYI